MPTDAIPIQSQSAPGIAALSLVGAMLVALEGKAMISPAEIDQIWELAISANEQIGDDGKTSLPNEEAASLLRKLRQEHQAWRARR